MFAKIKITGTICVKTGLHIGGSLDIAAIGAIDSPVIRDVISQKPMIPGSSLKGKMRSLLAKEYNGKSKKHEEDDERILQLFGYSKKDKVQSSRLLFSDMIMEDQEELKRELIAPTEVKFENTIHRLTGIANPRQIERVICGVKFPLEIIYNMEDENNLIRDFNTLKDAFTLLKYDYLGGHGSRGYGRVEVNHLDLEVCIGKVSDSLLEQCKHILKEV